MESYSEGRKESKRARLDESLSTRDVCEDVSKEMLGTESLIKIDFVGVRDAQHEYNKQYPHNAILALSS